MNLLEETKADIKDLGHKPEQIIFIGSVTSGHQCTWEQFCVLANREYNDGYGAQKVASDLTIAFKDGSTMWRHDDDSSESWRYSASFAKPDVSHPITTLISDGWDDLESMNPTAVKEA